MAYVLKIEEMEDQPVFYIHIDKKTKQVAYVENTHKATRFKTLTDLDEAIQYCHIHGYEIEKVK